MESNDPKYTVAEAIEAAQEALRRAYASARLFVEREEPTRVAYEIGRSFDSSAAFNRCLFPLWGTSLQIGLRATFDLQNAGVQSLRGLFDAAVLANRTWLDLIALSIRTSQDSIAVLVDAGFGRVESSERDAHI